MTKSSSSRLKRNTSKSNKNTAIFSIGGLLIFLTAAFFLFPYIIEGIGNLSQLMNNDKTNSGSQIQDDTILTPPTLTKVPQATSSARIKLTGKSTNRGTVEIYVNSSLQDEIVVDENEEFETDPLRLKEGSNDITTKLQTVDGESALSDVYKVSFLSKEPSLDISFPLDGAKLVKADKRIEVQGKTESNNKVSINGARVIVSNDGSFGYLIELGEGENQITVISSNEAGKTTEKKLTVTYSRE